MGLVEPSQNIQTYKTFEQVIDRLADQFTTVFERDKKTRTHTGIQLRGKKLENEKKGKKKDSTCEKY